MQNQFVHSPSLSARCLSYLLICADWLSALLLGRSLADSLRLLSTSSMICPPALVCSASKAQRHRRCQNTLTLRLQCKCTRRSPARRSLTQSANHHHSGPSSGYQAASPAPYFTYQNLTIRARRAEAIARSMKVSSPTLAIFILCASRDAFLLADTLLQRAPLREHHGAVVRRAVTCHLSRVTDRYTGMQASHRLTNTPSGVQPVLYPLQGSCICPDQHFSSAMLRPC